MAEAELHVLRARLEGGIENKAARGELRRGLPVGLIWGEADGEIRFHPDEAVTGVIAAVFEPVRRVRVGARHLAVAARPRACAGRCRRSPIPGAAAGSREITWVEPTYHAVHTTLTHPAYAGAYVYGRTRKERYLDAGGALRQRSRRLPRDQWEVLIPDHHPGFIDWDTYQANQARIGANIRPAGPPAGHRRGPGRLRAAAGPGHLRHVRPQAGDLLRRPGQMRAELLLPGLGRAGRRARRPAHERRRAGHRRRRRRRVPGRAGTRRPAMPACKPPASSKTATTPPWPSTGARSSRPATTPPGPNAATGPSTRTTGWSPAAWKPNGRPRSATSPTPRPSSPAARPPGRKPSPRRRKQAILALGDDLGAVWDAPTTTDKDRKQLLRTLLDEVNITLHRDDPGPHADLVLRWKGGAISELTVPLRRRQPKIRTDEDTIDLIRRLAVHYPDADHRRDPQPAAPHAPPADCRSPPVESPRCAPTGTSPATSPAATPPAEGDLLNVTAGRPPARHRAVHPAALAQRRLRRRRADHPRRALAHPPHRSAARHAHRRRPRRLGSPRLRHPGARRLPPDRIAEGQARRATRRPDPHRTQERPAYRGASPTRQASSEPATISKGAV